MHGQFILLISIAAGSFGVLSGIGCGIVLLNLIMSYPPKIFTTSNMIIGVTALAGTSVFLAAGLLKPGLSAVMALWVVLSAPGGTRVLVRL